MTLLNSQLNKLKSAIKNELITKRLSKKYVGTNKTNFPHNLLLTDKQVSSLCKAFANDLSVNKKYQKFNCPK